MNRIIAVTAILSMLWASVTTNVACFRRTAETCPKDVPSCEAPAPETSGSDFCCCGPEAAPQKPCGETSPCSQRRNLPKPADDGCPKGSGPCCLMMVVSTPEGLKWEAPPVIPEFIEVSPFVGELSIVLSHVSVDDIPPRSIHPIIATTVLLI